MRLLFAYLLHIQACYLKATYSYMDKYLCVLIFAFDIIVIEGT